MNFLLDPGSFVTRYAVGSNIYEIPIEDTNIPLGKTYFPPETILHLVEYIKGFPDNSFYQKSADLLFKDDTNIDISQLNDAPQFCSKTLPYKNQLENTTKKAGKSIKSLRNQDRFLITLNASPKHRYETAQLLFEGPLNESQLFFIEPCFSALLAHQLTSGIVIEFGQQLKAQKYINGYWPDPGNSIQITQIGNQEIHKQIRTFLEAEIKIEPKSLTVKRTTVLESRNILEKSQIILPDGNQIQIDQEKIQTLRNFYNQRDLGAILADGLKTALESLETTQTTFQEYPNSQNVIITGGLAGRLAIPQDFKRSEKPWLDGVIGLGVTAQVAQKEQFLTKQKLQEAGESYFHSDR